ncbi:hypothetical protein [Actinophytocola gossypii]|uniref:PPE domain-containing protein n=1 Tax=Actinophytocola gossypii TaxID=2812003 RepID=A0ABT2J427_9PSEU|nr:hypothetical protein [Actinophytocola gossypii]MCT2582622.1 hypothetical protein [Actinophytocola gossypii]
MTGHGERRVPTAAVHPAAFDHEQLKQWTDQAEPGAAQGVADHWASTGAALVEAGDALGRACATSESGWTGEAAEAMRARLNEIAAWSRTTGARITEASQAVARQGEAAETARRAMPEPVPYDPAGMIREASGGGLLGLAALPQRLFAQKQRHDAAHAEAVRVVTERDNAMHSAAGTVAVFELPPTLDGSAVRVSRATPPPAPAPVRVAIPAQPGGPVADAPTGFLRTVDGVFDDVFDDSGDAVRTAPAVLGGPDEG